MSLEHDKHTARNFSQSDDRRVKLHDEGMHVNAAEQARCMRHLYIYGMFTIGIDK